VPEKVTFTAGGTATYQITHDKLNSNLNVYFQVSSGRATMYLCRMESLNECEDKALVTFTSTDFYQNPEYVGEYIIKVSCPSAAVVTLQAESAMRPVQQYASNLTQPWSSAYPENFHRLQFLVCPEPGEHSPLTFQVLGGGGKLYVSKGEYYIEDPTECNPQLEIACGETEVVVENVSLDMYRITLFGDTDTSWPVTVNFHDGAWLSDAEIDGKAYPEYVCSERNCGGRFVLDLSEHASHDNLVVSVSPLTPNLDGTLSLMLAANFPDCFSLFLDKCVFGLLGSMVTVNRATLDNFVNSEANVGRDPVAYLLATPSSATTYPGDENWDKRIPVRLVAQWDASTATSGKDAALSIPTSSSGGDNAKLVGVTFSSVLKDAPLSQQESVSITAYEAVLVSADQAHEDLVDLNLDVSPSGFPATSGTSAGTKVSFSLPFGYGHAILIPVGKNQDTADASPLFSRIEATAKAGVTAPGELDVTLKSGGLFEVPAGSSVTFNADSSERVFMRALVTPEIAKSGVFQIKGSVDGTGCSSKTVSIVAASRYVFPDASANEWSSEGKGSASLDISISNGVTPGPQEGDFIYFRVSSTGSCSVEVHTGESGSSLAIDIGDGKVWNFDTNVDNETLKLKFTPKPSAVDGYSGSMKTNGFFELIVGTDNPLMAEKKHFEISATKKYYDGEARKAYLVGNKNIIDQGAVGLSYQSGVAKAYRFVLPLDTRLVDTVYITVTRYDESYGPVTLDTIESSPVRPPETSPPADDPDTPDPLIRITVMAGTFEELEGDITYSIKTPRATGAVQYYSVHTTPLHDWTLDLQVRKPTSTSFTVMVCPNYPPISASNAEDVNNCMNITTASESVPAQFAYTWDSPRYRSGVFYIAVIADAAAQEANAHFTLTVRHSARIELERATTLKVMGGTPYYFSMRMPGDYDSDSDLIGILGSCRNCVVCYSLTKQHPVFDPAAFGRSSDNSGDCELLLGILAGDGEDEEDDPKYDTMGTVDVPAGAKWLFGAVYSLEQPGLSQSVIFTTKLQQRVMHDQQAFVNLGYTESSSGELGDDDEESYYFLQHHLQIELPSPDEMEGLLYYTLVVSPAEANNLAYMVLTRYNVFTSFVQPAPSFYNAEAMSQFSSGSIVMSFDQSEIRQREYLYVTVEATADTPWQFTNTSIALYTQAGGTIFPLRYMVYNPSPVVPDGEKRVYHFDATSFPLDIRMEPCRGHPIIRGGITDFYRRTDADGTDETAKIEAKERVIARYDIPYGKEAPVILRPSTMYSPGSWFFEVGDYRTDAPEGKWSVSMYASSTDPRPGVALTTLQVYDAGKGRIEVAFHPAIPSTHNSTVKDLEYDIYAMPASWKPEDYEHYLETGEEGAVDTTAHVPYTACGMLQGGGSIGAGWTTFEEWDEFFSLTSEKTLRDVGDAEGYWVTVIVRQKNTLLFNTYGAHYVDPNALQARQKGSNTVGLIVGITVAVVVVIVAATVTAIILLRRKAKKTNRAAGEKAFLNLDRDLLLPD